MNQHDETPVKDLLKRHPGFVDVIRKFNFPCETCKKNCLIKKIPEMENLSLSEEIEFAEAVARFPEEKTV